MKKRIELATLLTTIYKLQWERLSSLEGKMSYKTQGIPVVSRICGQWHIQDEQTSIKRSTILSNLLPQSNVYIAQQPFLTVSIYKT